MSNPTAIEYQLETALIAWLNDTATHGKSFSGIAIRREQEDGADRMTLPAIVVKVTRESEEIGTGVWQCLVDVSLLTNAMDTADADRVTAWDSLFSVLTWDTLASKMTISSTVATYAVRYMQGTQQEEAEAHNVSRLTFTCWSYSL